MKLTPVQLTQDLQLVFKYCLNCIVSFSLYYGFEIANKTVRIIFSVYVLMKKVTDNLSAL